MFDLIISIFLRVRWTTLIALIYKNDVFKKAIKIITELFIHSFLLLFNFIFIPILNEISFNLFGD